MFKKTLATALALVMLVACFAMLVPVSADTATAPSLENLYVFDGEGVASTETAGGPVGNNGSSQYNYVTGKNIPVATGDKIYIGPILREQGYHMVSYNAAGAVVKTQVTSSDNDVEIIPMNAIDPNTSILCYTVPEGVASITPVISQMFKYYVLITKNAPFTPLDYVNYWEAKDVNIKALIGGGTYSLDPAALTDVSATGGIFPGRANNKTGSSIENDNLLSASAYFCTQGYVEVKTGDIAYFVGEKNQGYHLTMYADNKDAVSTVQKPYVVQYDDIGGNYAIYAYRIRPGVKYIRYTFAAALHNAGLQLLTINQPFTEKTLRMYAQTKGVAANTVDALFGEYNILFLGSKNIGSSYKSDSAAGVHKAFELTLENALGINANAEIVEDSSFAINMLATEANERAVAMNEKLGAKDWDIIIVQITRRCTPTGTDVIASELAAFKKILPSLKAETNEIYLFCQEGSSNPSIFTTANGTVNYTDTNAKENLTVAESTAFLINLGKTFAEETGCYYIKQGDSFFPWYESSTTSERKDPPRAYLMACSIYYTIFGDMPETANFTNTVDATLAAKLNSYAKAACYTPFPTESVKFEILPEAPATPPTSDAMIVVIALIGTISLVGVVVLGKKVRS